MKLTEEQKRILTAVNNIKLIKQYYIKYLENKSFKTKKEYNKLETLKDELSLFRLLNNFDKMKNLVEVYEDEFGETIYK